MEDKTPAPSETCCVFLSTGFVCFYLVAEEYVGIYCFHAAGKHDAVAPSCPDGGALWPIALCQM